jgi:uncharacterized membrane protein YhhN
MMPHALPVVATALCAAATVALVVAERRGSTAGRYLAKPLAAFAFVTVPLLGGASLEQRYPALILAGLVLGAGGDLGLMLPGRRAFTVGTGLFLLGHLAYVAAALELGPAGDWLRPHAAAPLLLAALVIRWLWPHLGRPGAPAPRPLVILYVAVISTMLLAAVSPLAAGAREPRAVLLALGAALFVASDLAVARHRFVAPGFGNKLLGQPAYFAAQLLIAWSTIA